MRRRALLAVIVALLLVGAYGAYVVSYPKYPEVKGCVNPFVVTKPVSRVQENWSKAHVFLKLATSRDFWKLAKPWDVDYSHVKVVKHTIEYNGEKITMLAMGIPLKDKKHVIALYEFSKPVQGVKVRGYLIEIDNPQKTQKSTPTIKTVALTTNGKYTATSSCTHECGSGYGSCGYLEQCHSYCCRFNWDRVLVCCGACRFAGPLIYECIFTLCAYCIFTACEEFGSVCEPWTPGH